MPTEIIGLWDDLVSRPEFRGHQVRVTIVDEVASESDVTPDSEDSVWLKALYDMAANGVRVASLADDSRGGIYEGSE